MKRNIPAAHWDNTKLYVFTLLSELSAIEYSFKKLELVVVSDFSDVFLWFEGNEYAKFPAAFADDIAEYRLLQKAYKLTAGAYLVPPYNKSV